MTRYVALLDGKPGAYGVVVPDLPGCTTAAATTDEALRRATEAVRLWAEDALADGEKLPKPRSAEALRTDPEVATALAQGAALPLYRSSAMQAGRPRRISRSTLACSRRSTRQPPRVALLARPFPSAAREKIESEG